MLHHGDKKILVIGGGPAGLTAAYELCTLGEEPIVLEKDYIVGGISRTVDYKGYLFDIGGHRFFTKVKVVEDLWREVLAGEEFLRRKRLSRIYYNKKFFYYPLRPANALLGLGLLNSFLILASYVNAKIFPSKLEETFEQWVSNRFGKRLYSIFFKTYTEKVWGMPANEITALWAAQRIKGLSLLTAIKDALLSQRQNNESVIKTLIDEFDYPTRGPGMMWEKMVPIIQERGGQVRLGASVENIFCANGKVEALEIKVDGQNDLLKGTHFISSMPIRELIRKIKPSLPAEVLLAAKNLRYRDFITVALIVDKSDVFPDNWIYIHDPDVQVGRIQNFKNWSPHMVPDSNKTCLGLEYFCFEGDGLWTMSDQDLVELGKKELGILGLVRPSDIEDGTVVRMPKAYPVYDSTYVESLQVIRQSLRQFDNLQLVGRNGMHMYNNMDHSMLTAMLAVKNILGANYDLWKVNVDQKYHEEGAAPGIKEDEFAQFASTQPFVPERVVSDKMLIQKFARLDKLAFAVSVGSVCGLAVFIATFWLMMMGDKASASSFQLLGQYFVGYTVTGKGAFLGLAYGFFWSFLFGWLFAYLRNLFLAIFIYNLRKKAESLAFKDFIDHF